LCDSVFRDATARHPACGQTDHTPECNAHAIRGRRGAGYRPRHAACWHDAYLRKYALWVPADCVASERDANRRTALAYMARTLKAEFHPVDR
jgi:hypothetical protein